MPMMSKDKPINKSVFKSIVLFNITEKRAMRTIVSYAKNNRYSLRLIPFWIPYNLYYKVIPRILRWEILILIHLRWVWYTSERINNYNNFCAFPYFQQITVFPQYDYANIQSSHIGHILVDYYSIVEIPIQPEFYDSNERIRQFKPSVRNCYFPDEGQKVLNRLGN